MSSDNSKLQALCSASAAKSRYISDERNPDTMNSGVQHGQALYNSPTLALQSEVLHHSQRSRTQTARIQPFHQEHERSRCRSTKIQRTKACKAWSQKTRQSQRPTQSQNLSGGEENDIDEQSGEGSEADEIDIQCESEQEESSDTKMEYNNKPEVRGGSRTPLLEALGATYRRENLAALPTEELHEMLAALCDDQATSVDAEEQYPKIKLLPGEESEELEEPEEPEGVNGATQNRGTTAATAPLAPPVKRSLIVLPPGAVKCVRLATNSASQSSAVHSSSPPPPIPPPNFAAQSTHRSNPGLAGWPRTPHIPQSRAGPGSVARPCGLPKSCAGPNAVQQIISGPTSSTGHQACPSASCAPPSTSSSHVPGVTDIIQPDGCSDSQANTSHHRWRDAVKKRNRTLLDSRRYHRRPGISEPMYMCSSSPEDLMTDNDEEMMEAEAIAEGKISTQRKTKPAARNFSGNARQVLTLAILDLLAYLCAEGPYENRETYWIWAEEAYKRCWLDALPGVPYEPPLDDILRVIVNRVATYRGKVKERIRAVVEHLYNLRNPPLSEEDIQHNRAIVKQLNPNTFHCRVFSPRSGHYEHPAIWRSLAVALFYKHDAVGILHRDYFNPIPLPTMAFILTTMQSCFNEWATGRFTPIDLNATEQYGAYVSHMQGFMEYGRVAGHRLRCFQEEWHAYCLAYSGVEDADTSARFAQEVTLASEIRADTPVPDNNSELDLEGVRWSSEMDVDDCWREIVPERQAEEPQGEEPAAEGSEEDSPVEYNEESVLTACSKGKGHAMQ